MWVKGHEKDLINLALAERLYIQPGKEESFVYAQMRGGSWLLLYVGPNEQDCQHWMDKIGVRLASIANGPQ